MNYIDAMNYIEEKNKLGSVPGLDNITELLRRLDNPQNKIKCLQIAGTNGKGSVFSFVESSLIAAGLKVGRYISPTIETYLERFQINKKYMDKRTFTRLLKKVSVHVDAMVEEGLLSPTAFEIETAIAFLYYVDEQVDYALIECGMGGRLDATNVIEKPVLSCFATISMDHMAILGDTLEKIALEKSGILKDEGICIAGVQEQVVYDILKEESYKKKNHFIKADMDLVHIESMDLNGSVFSYKDEQYEIGLLGEHQIKNAITAIEVLKQIREVSSDDIKSGLKATTWVGRMTKVGENPLMFVDGAHNEDAWISLQKMVKLYFTKRPIIYIIGVLKDKEYDKMVKILAPTMDVAITITPNNARGLDKAILSKLIRDEGVPVKMAENAASAIALAKQEVIVWGKDSELEPVIMVCGSLSFLKDYIWNE